MDASVETSAVYFLLRTQPHASSTLIIAKEFLSQKENYTSAFQDILKCTGVILFLLFNEQLQGMNLAAL
jgi:hypothetical protein